MSPTNGQLGPKANQPEPNEHKLIFKIERLIWEGLKDSQTHSEQTQGQLDPLQNGV